MLYAKRMFEQAEATFPLKKYIYCLYLHSYNENLNKG